jgi:enediyne biosynthesis protein E5
VATEFSAPLPSSPVAPAAKSRLAWFFSFENRFLAPLLITLILAVGQITYGLLESYSRLWLAIGTSIAVELALGRMFLGKWPHPASAYISGISIGMLVRSPEYWPYALCAAIAITSKYVIRWRGRHLWNPSNFAICAMLLLAPYTVASLSVQWGNDVWPMLVVWAVGSIIIYRLRRFHITLTYVVSFIAFAFVRSLITGDGFLAEVAPITGPMYQLFIFFMITDPPTTVRAKWGQCVVAFLVAAVECALRLMENVHAPYYALTIVGPLAVALEIWLTPRRAPERAAAAAAAS